MQCHWTKRMPPVLALLQSACVALDQGSRYYLGASLYSCLNDDCIFIQKDKLSSEAPHVYGIELQLSHGLETSALKTWTPW